MNTVARQYVEAVTEMLVSGKELGKVIKDLRVVMSEHGHEKILPAVLKGVVEKLSVKEKATVSRLTLAKGEDAKKFPELTKDAVIDIDPTIIGGYVLTQNHRRTDQSYKRRLLDWYQRAIKD